MKVGVLQFFSWPERRVPLETVYERAFERIAIMDQTGYDCVWLAEHHFGSYSICPSVHMMATHIAARTQNLRIGMAVSLAAFYHPLRLAEEVALLDVLTRGRVNWGAGRGFDKTEFEAFGVPREESYPRFREAIDVVLQAWTQERVDFDGQFWHFKDVEVLPKPFQKPHPPVWMASSSVGAIDWAAEQGFSILMDPHSTHGEIKEKYRHYLNRLVEHGHSTEGRQTPVARLLAVADTHEEAEEIAGRGAKWMFGSYLSPKLGNLTSDFRSSESRVLAAMSSVGKTAEQTAERYLEDVIIYGTPEAVTDQLKQLQEEIPLGYLLCAPLSHGTFMTFTEKVLPKLL